jgi:hypothetical protein
VERDKKIQKKFSFASAYLRKCARQAERLDRPGFIEGNEYTKPIRSKEVSICLDFVIANPFPGQLYFCSIVTA